MRRGSGDVYRGALHGRQDPEDHPQRSRDKKDKKDKKDCSRWNNVDGPNYIHKQSCKSIMSDPN